MPIERYQPLQVPKDEKALARFLTSELRKIRKTLDALADGHLEIYHAEPNKKREGDIVFADGSDWNPNASGSPPSGGEGKGVYVYYNDKWNMLASCLNDLADVDINTDDPLALDYDNAILSYDYDLGLWVPEKITEAYARTTYTQMIIPPSATTWPDFTFSTGMTGTLPFYPYKPGWGGSPPNWHGFQFLDGDDAILVEHKNHGAGFVYDEPYDGRFTCQRYGDIMMELNIDVGSDSNNTSVGWGVSRENENGKLYYPIVATGLVPNIGKPTSMTSSVVIPVNEGDKIGLGICADKNCKLTFYNGAVIAEYKSDYTPRP